MGLNYKKAIRSEHQFVFIQVKISSYFQKLILPPDEAMSQTFPMPPRWLEPIVIMPIRPPMTTNVWNVSVHSTALRPPWNDNKFHECVGIDGCSVTLVEQWLIKSLICWRYIINKLKENCFFLLSVRKLVSSTEQQM